MTPMDALLRNARDCLPLEPAECFDAWRGSGGPRQWPCTARMDYSRVRT